MSYPEKCIVKGCKRGSKRAPLTSEDQRGVAPGVSGIFLTNEQRNGMPIAGPFCVAHEKSITWDMAQRTWLAARNQREMDEAIATLARELAEI